MSWLPEGDGVVDERGVLEFSEGLIRQYPGEGGDS